ncbi:uncharacterized protein VTP21DRAFT_4796 [Calcarisporiella thermophila]|uniref:uncharacterized protein n=1 Tax=Calcarisporiella thermophila TaxID=911321 RepID=UPI0037449431
MSSPADPEVQGNKLKLDALAQVEDYSGDGPSATQIASTRGQPVTSKKELWAYYLLYNGNNGTAINVLMLGALLPQVLFAAGVDSTTGEKCDGGHPSTCVINGLNYSSWTYLTQGICFAIQMILFVTIGSMADHQRWGYWFLLFFNVSCIAVHFLFLIPNMDWMAVSALTSIANILYGGTLVFYWCIFPRLAQNIPEVRQAIDESKPALEVERLTSAAKSHISAVSTAWSNVGYLALTAILSLAGLSSTYKENSYLSNNIGIVVCAVFWIISAIPYIFWSQNRSGPPKPPGSNYLTLGLKRNWFALKEAKKLKQLFKYLLAYFILSDGISTINAILGVFQNQAAKFIDPTTFVVTVNLVGAFCSIIGCFGMLYVQKYFRLSSKIMLLFIIVGSLFQAVWGLIGTWTDSIGYHNMWEIYFFYIINGIFTAPYWAYAGTVLSELIPRGHEAQFFGLMGFMNKASAWIGPFIITAIQEASGNQSLPWVFVVCIFVLSIFLILWVDIDSAKVDADEYLRQEARQREISSGLVPVTPGVASDKVEES